MSARLYVSQVLHTFNKVVSPPHQNIPSSYTVLLADPSFHSSINVLKHKASETERRMFRPNSYNFSNGQWKKTALNGPICFCSECKLTSWVASFEGASLYLYSFFPVLENV